MQTFLITGADEKGRLKKFEEIVGEKLSSLKNSPDFYLLKTEENSIGIAEVRTLQENLSLRPYERENKIVLIYEAQNLTIEAQNSLLKALEEPDITSLIYLTAPDSSFLLPTIASRCQIIYLPNKNGVEIDEKEEQKTNELFQNLLKASAGKRFKILEEEGIAKDRASAIKFLDKLLFVIRKKTINRLQKDQSWSLIPNNKIQKIS